MPYHPESYKLCQFILQAIPEFVEPIEEVAWSNWEPGDDEVDGLNSLYISFFSLGLQMAHADGDVSEKETALLQDVDALFKDQDDDESDLSMRRMRDVNREIVRDNPELFGEVKVPVAVRYLEIYDDGHGTDYANRAKAMYFRFANAIIKADGKVTAREQEALSNLKDLLYACRLSSAPTFDEGSSNCSDAARDHANEEKSLDELLEELNKLIGLDAVKNDVRQMVNFLRVQQMRRDSGMVHIPVSRHLVFYGNPGTGKTTVARLLAQIYRSMGVVTKGHLGAAEK